MRKLFLMSFFFLLCDGQVAHALTAAEAQAQAQAEGKAQEQAEVRVLARQAKGSIPTPGLPRSRVDDDKGRPTGEQPIAARPPLPPNGSFSSTLEPVEPTAPPGGLPVRPTTGDMVDATTAGFKTIGAYEQGALKLLNEQHQARADLEKFRKKMEQIEADNRKIAVDYARKAAETKTALARLQNIPAGETNPVASRAPPAAEPVPNTFETSPAANFAMPSFSPAAPSENYAAPVTEEQAKKVNPAVADVSAFQSTLEEGRHFENNSSSEAPKGSTIAVLPANEKPESDSKSSPKIVLGKAGKGINKNGASTLRNAIKDALARTPASNGGDGKGAESGSQEATRSALEEMRTLASTDGGNQNGNAAGGAQMESPLTTFDSGGLKGSGFKMDGSETAKEVARLKGDVVEKQAAPEVLGKESQGLFERVRGAHIRSQKNGRLSLANQKQ